MLASCVKVCMSGMQAAFEGTRSSLVGRPWAVDDLDRILQSWQHRQYRKAILFVDNAGSDVILGALLRQSLFLLRVLSPDICTC